MAVNKLTEHFFRADRPVFTQADVAVAIERTDFSRHGLIKRAIASGEILNVRRGLYCLAEPYQKRPVRVYSISQHVYGPSYVSLESALSLHGWIPEAVYGCTCVSFNNAKEFDTPLGLFSYKRAAQKTFYTGVERCVDEHGNVFFMASPAKALADYVYVRRLTWPDVDGAIDSLRIEPEEFTSTQPGELSELVSNYGSRRVKRFLNGWLQLLEEATA